MGTRSTLRPSSPWTWLRKPHPQPSPPQLLLPALGLPDGSCLSDAHQAPERAGSGCAVAAGLLGRSRPSWPLRQPVLRGSQEAFSEDPLGRSFPDAERSLAGGATCLCSGVPPLHLLAPVYICSVVLGTAPKVMTSRQSRGPFRLFFSRNSS